MITAIVCKPPGKLQRGFVLVASLWVLASLSLFVAYFSVVVDRIQNNAIEVKNQLSADMERRATEATVLYSLATRPMNYGGLNLSPRPKAQPSEGLDPLSQTDSYTPQGDEVRLDGSLYAGLGETRFRLQDAGSLISLRSDNYLRLRRLLRERGLAPGLVSQFTSRLRDYTDRDSLLSLQGAESQDYLSAGMQPPTNRYLISPLQVYNLLVDPEISSVLGALLPELTIYVADRQNFNTMSYAGMRTLGSFGLDENALRRIMAAREKAAFSDLGQVNRVAGSLIPFDPMNSAFFPSRYLRLSLHTEKDRQSHWLGITLTPDSTLAPWQIDYRFPWPENNSKQRDPIAQDASEIPTDLPAPLFR